MRHHDLGSFITCLLSRGVIINKGALSDKLWRSVAPLTYDPASKMNHWEGFALSQDTIAA